MSKDCSIKAEFSLCKLYLFLCNVQSTDRKFRFYHEQQNHIMYDTFSWLIFEISNNMEWNFLQSPNQIYLVSALNCPVWF